MDTSIKHELYLLVQGSVFAFGGDSCLQAGRYPWGKRIGALPEPKKIDAEIRPYSPYIFR